MDKQKLIELANNIIAQYLYNNPRSAPQVKQCRSGVYCPFDEMNAGGSILVEYTRGRKRLIEDYNQGNLFPEYSMIRSTRAFAVRNSSNPFKWYRHNGVSIGTLNLNNAKKIIIEENLLRIDNFIIDFEVNSTLSQSHTLELIKAPDPSLECIYNNIMIGDNEFSNMIGSMDISNYHVKEIMRKAINEFKRLML